MKKLEMNIVTCADCPFCRYDSYYSMSTDSGYDCHHENGVGRLVDDGVVNIYDRKIKDIEKQNKTLFKYDGAIPENPFTIPGNCPLRDI